MFSFGRYRAEMASCPDAWFRLKSVEYAKVTLAKMAEFVNAKTDNLVFLMNATTGTAMNSSAFFQFSN